MFSRLKGLLTVVCVLSLGACSLPAAPPAPPPGLALGTAVNNGRTSLALLGTKTRPSVGVAGHVVTPPDGQVFAVVQAEAKNLIGKKVVRTDWLTVYLVDPESGVAYSEYEAAEAAYATEPQAADSFFASHPSPDDFVSSGVFSVPSSFDAKTWYAVTPDGTKLALQ